MGLTETSFPITYSGMPCPYTHGYSWVNNETWVDYTVTRPTWAWAAGAMVSDMDDMKKWVKAYALGTTNSEKAQADRLRFVDTGEKLYTFGFGIVNMTGWLGYTGGLPGYNTAAYYLPEKDATIIVFAMGGEEVSSANRILLGLMNVTTPGADAGSEVAGRVVDDGSGLVQFSLFSHWQASCSWQDAAERRKRQKRRNLQNSRRLSE